MSLFKNTRFVLILILLLAALLRLPFLGLLPAGITIDEAGQGYSAYSILRTGSDEWGDFLPINPRGFGDYKPPVFMYLLVPSVALFGLSEFALRLPSALAGILTVWIVFFLVRRLFNSKLGLLAAFFMAISPCLVYYSRLGWESNIGLLFFILGIWLFVKTLGKGWFCALSALNFSLAGLSYHSFKLLAPLMVLSLITIFWKEIKKAGKKELIAPVFVVLVFILLLGYGFIFSGASRRAQDQSIFKEENLSDLRKKQYEDGLPQPFNRVVFNKYQFLASKISDNYLGYYSLPFLFGPHRSDGSILNFPSMGLLYIWQLPLILIGIWYLLKNKSKGSAVLFAWLILAPIPAALTQDYMHAGRSQAIFPALTIISAIGLWYGLALVSDKKIRKISMMGMSTVLVLSIFWRIDNYLFHTFNQPLGGLKQGYKEIVDLTQSNYDKYDKIIFTKSGSEPQAFIGFYAKINPSDFQSYSQDWKHFEDDGFRFLDMTDYKLGKYEFKNIDFSRDRNEKNTLIIASPKEIPSLVVPKLQISDLLGNVVFVVIDTNEIAN